MSFEWTSLEDYSHDPHMMMVSQVIDLFRSLNYSHMLLIQFMFHVQIVELENRLSRVKNELKTMKEEEAATKEEEARKKEEAKKEQEAKKPKETAKDMVVIWWKDGGQGCSSEDVVVVCLIIYIYMDEQCSHWPWMMNNIYSCPKTCWMNNVFV
jgi:hypothetical protein